MHSLREFECPSVDPLELTSFESLLQSNKELQRFTVTYLKHDGVTDEDLELGTFRLVRSLVQYKSVIEFNVHWPRWTSISTKISNACVPLRGRQLNLVVGDIVYLPKSNSPQVRFHGGKWFRISLVSGTIEERTGFRTK